MLNNAKVHIVEDANKVGEYMQPENMFMAIEDSDLSLEENQITNNAKHRGRVPRRVN